MIYMKQKYERFFLEKIYKPFMEVMIKKNPNRESSFMDKNA